MSSRRPRLADGLRGLRWFPGALRLALGGSATAVTGLAAAGPVPAVAGTTLLVLVLACGLWVGLLGASARAAVRPTGGTAVEGDHVELALELGGIPPWGRAAIRVEHPLLRAPLRLGALGRTLRRRRRTLALALVAHGRGELPIGPTTLRVADPFALWELRREAASAVAPLLVLPRLEPVVWRVAPGALGPVGGERPSPGPAGVEVDVIGLREHRAGTPATRIHWPSLAGGGPLLERAPLPRPDPTPLVLLDGRLPDLGPATVAAFEALVRAVGSLVRDLAGRGPVELWLPDRGDPWPVALAPARWDPVHRALALVDPVDTRPPLERLAPGRDLVHAAVWSAAEPPAGPPWFEVAGCVGIADPARGRIVLASVPR